MSKNSNILINDFKLFDEGVIEACTVVGSSLGVEGKLSLLDSGTQAPPRTSKDGISIMKNIRFENKTKNFGAIKAIEASGLTLQKSGDSTTSTAVMLKYYLENFKRNKFNKAVERGIYKAVNEVYAHLSKLSKTATKKQLKQIIKVSANNDSEIADIISEAYEYSGKENILEVVLDKNKETTTLVKQDGLRVEGHGYASEYFCNQESKQMAFEGNNVAILTASTWEYSQHIINQIKLFYDSAGNRLTPLAIFLEKPNSDMLEKLIGIKEIGFNLVLIYTNENTEFESETLLKDIANFTGASVYNPRNPDAKIEFGLADKLVANLDSTTIIVEDVPQIFKETLENLKSADKKDNRRIKRLTTKASVIHVGGTSPSIAEEAYDRFEDAVFSLKTSQAEGVIPGGGSSLVYISGLMNTKLSNREEQQGYDLVKGCMKAVFLQILKNGNRKQRKWYQFWNKDYLSPTLEEFGVGYNATTDEISNLYDQGILDSKKSIRVAIESSLEIAVQLFNLGSICHFPETQNLD